MSLNPLLYQKNSQYFSEINMLLFINDGCFYSCFFLVTIKTVLDNQRPS